MIILSERYSKYNVHTPFISSEIDLHYVNLEEDMLSFDTKDEAISFLNKLSIDLNRILINDDEVLFDYKSRYENSNKKDRQQYPTILKDEKTFNVTSKILWSSAFFEYPEETLLAMRNIELTSAYYDNQSLIDFRLYGLNRFDEYEDDIVIQIID